MKHRLFGAIAIAVIVASPTAYASAAKVPLPPVRSESTSTHASSEPLKLAQVETDVVRSHRRYDRPRSHRLRHRLHDRNCTVIVTRRRTVEGWVTRRVRRCH